jgi:hypothetical protein
MVSKAAKINELQDAKARHGFLNILISFRLRYKPRPRPRTRPKF